MRGPKLRSSALRGVVIVAVLGGCATLPPAPREPITGEARAIIVKLDARAREFASLRTLADVVVQQRGDRTHLRGVLLARAPASVRFEALSPMGPPLLIATVHAGRITAYDATSNEGYSGPATPEVTGRFLHLPFEPADLVGILAGAPLPPPDVRAASVLAADDVGPSIEIIGQDNRRRIWFDPDTATVRQFELTGGRAEARIRYVRNGRGELAGFDVSASLGLAGATVRYQNPGFAVPLAPEAFDFTIPKGAKIQEIR